MNVGTLLPILQNMSTMNKHLATNWITSTKWKDSQKHESYQGKITKKQRL